jgi:hypothetical protein
VKTVFKYTSPLQERITLLVPRISKLLHVDTDTRDPDALAFWYEVDTRVNAWENRFVIVGTGQEIPPDAIEHVASVKTGAFIWHIYRAMK